MAAKNTKKAAKNQEKQEKRSSGIVFGLLAGIVFFLVICLCADGNIKAVSILLVLLCLGLGALRFKTIKSWLNLPMLALMLFVLMCGVSTFYAQSGKLALEEFLKLLAGFCAAVSLGLIFSGEKSGGEKGLAFAAEIAIALAALLSIDLLSTRILSGLVMGIMEKLDPYYGNLSGVEVGVRLTSIFKKPNIFAGCAGIGVLLSLGLAVSCRDKGEKRIHLCCLYISSVAFVLAFSMGAVAAIVLAFLVFLFMEDAGRRAALLITMVETLVLSALSVMLISLRCLDAWDGIDILPLLCLAALCAVLCLAQEKLGGVEEKLRDKGKNLALCCGGIVVLLLGFVFAAYNLSAGVELEEGRGLSRSAYPAAGEYSVSLEGGAGLELEIVSQSSADTMMHTETQLYSGLAQGAHFTVPEDSVVVYFRLRATQDTRLEKLEFYGDAGSGSLKLDYLLLPDFMANRIQGLFANQNAIQRLVFFRDGMKLFARSPIIGLGMGSYESGVQSVQEFHYETKYVHNHYIQTLLETGVIGLAIFLFLLLCSALALVLAKRRGQMHPLCPALAALLVFMAVHGAVEVVFSAYCYLPLACTVFVLISRCCGDGLQLRLHSERIRSGIAIGMAALMLVYAGFVGVGAAAGNAARKQGSYKALERAAALDIFDGETFAMSYLLQAVSDRNATPAVKNQAQEFASKLEKGNSHTRFYYLADYYFALDNVEKGFEMAAKHAENTISSSREWNNIFQLLRMHNVKGEQAAQALTELVEMMEAWDEQNMGSISLEQENLDYIEKILG